MEWAAEEINISWWNPHYRSGEKEGLSLAISGKDQATVYLSRGNENQQSEETPSCESLHISHYGCIGILSTLCDLFQHVYLSGFLDMTDSSVKSGSHVAMHVES